MSPPRRHRASAEARDDGKAVRTTREGVALSDEADVGGFDGAIHAIDVVPPLPDE